MAQVVWKNEFYDTTLNHFVAVCKGPAWGFAQTLTSDPHRYPDLQNETSSNDNSSIGVLGVQSNFPLFGFWKLVK